MKTTPITAEQYLRGKFYKDRKTDMLDDILKNFKYQTQHDDTNIHSDEGHNKPSHTMPFINTAIHIWWKSVIQTITK